MRYSIEVSGIEKVVANLNKLQALIKWNGKQGLVNASEKLRDSAIASLANSTWSPSVNDLSIRDKSSWINTGGSQNMVNLVCISEHALAVEKGTWGSPKLRDGRFHADELTQTGGPFPVGLNQGMLVWFAGGIAPQPPKNYLTGAMKNPTTINEMINEVGKVLKSSIAQVGG